MLGDTGRGNVQVEVEVEVPLEPSQEPVARIFFFAIAIPCSRVPLPHSTECSFALGEAGGAVARHNAG